MPAIFNNNCWNQNIRHQTISHAWDMIKKMPVLPTTAEINMLSQLNTFTIEHAFEVFIFALLFTGHVCLFFDLSRFQKLPLSNLNYVGSGVLSALITTGCFYAVSLSSMTDKIVLITAIGFISATAITLTIQRISNRLFHRNKTAN